ncbi:MAG: HAD family hydrolase [Halioglobus sp.]
MIEPLPSRSPARGDVPIKAVVFDTFGTVCDFYHTFLPGFERLCEARGVDCDPSRLAIDWRTAYVFTTATQAFEETAFRPLADINRDNLVQLMHERADLSLSVDEIEGMLRLWREMAAWPDVVEGLTMIGERAVIGPLSNGNFTDMAYLARYARLPWDVILGSSLSGYYKPHPDTYLRSVAVLGLQPSEVCMVAAHQADLGFAAGHGMQTAFVGRPDEFGGAVKPAEPEPGVAYFDVAEVHPEADWTYVATDFVDLAQQLRE